MIKTKEVDCDKDPHLYRGWNVEQHAKLGKLRADKMNLGFFKSELQKDGASITLEKFIKEEISGRKCANANILDYMLQVRLHESGLVFRKFKEKAPNGQFKKWLFPGTIYVIPISHGISLGLGVRYLTWDGQQYISGYIFYEEDLTSEFETVLLSD